MSPLHKALYRKMLNANCEPDERQERMINAELARCLVWIYWISGIMMLLCLFHDKLQGNAISALTLTWMFIFLFIAMFTTVNRLSWELTRPEHIRAETLPHYLKQYKINIFWDGVFSATLVSIMGMNAIRPIYLSFILGTVFIALLKIKLYHEEKAALLQMLSDKPSDQEEKDDEPAA